MLKSNYYDQPDGKDFSGKLAATNKYAVCFGISEQGDQSSGPFNTASFLPGCGRVNLSHLRCSAVLEAEGYLEHHRPIRVPCRTNDGNSNCIHHRNLCGHQVPWKGRLLQLCAGRNRCWWSRWGVEQVLCHWLSRWTDNGWVEVRSAIGGREWMNCLLFSWSWFHSTNGHVRGLGIQQSELATGLSDPEHAKERPHRVQWSRQEVDERLLISMRWMLIN